MELSVPVDQLERVAGLLATASSDRGAALPAVVWAQVVPGGVRWLVRAPGAFFELGSPGRILASMALPAELVEVLAEHARVLAVPSIRLDTDAPGTVGLGMLTVVVPRLDEIELAALTAGVDAEPAAQVPVDDRLETGPAGQRRPRLEVDRGTFLAGLDAAMAHPAHCDALPEVLVTADPDSATIALRRTRPGPAGPVSLVPMTGDARLTMRLRADIVGELIRRLVEPGMLELEVVRSAPTVGSDDGSRWLTGRTGEGVRFGLLAGDGRAEARRHDIEAAISALMELPADAAEALRDLEGDYPVAYDGRRYYARLRAADRDGVAWEPRVRITTFVPGPNPDVEAAARAEKIGPVVQPDGSLALSIDLALDPLGDFVARADEAVRTLHLVTAGSD